MLRYSFSGLAFAFALLVAGSSWAEDVTPQARAQAVELFDAAAALAQQGRYADACPKFADSYRLDPQLGALLHLADCLERNGQLASAYAAFRDASELAGKKADPRRELADDHVKAIAPRLSRLTVSVSAAARVPGLLVGRDGIALDAATWGTAIAVDPGEHHVTATAPGYKPWSATLNVIADGSAESTEVPALEPLPGASNQSSKQPPPQPADRAPTPGATQRLLGYVAGGVGVVGIGLGLGFALDRKSKIDDANGICAGPSNACPDGNVDQSQSRLNKLNGDARTAGTIATVAFVAGGVAIAGGVALVLTAPHGSAPVQQGSLSLFPWVGSGGGGLIARRSF